MTGNEDERLCPFPGCDELIPKKSRGCTTHRNKLSEWDAARRRSHPRNLIYSDPRWRVCRELVKARDNWTCIDCGKRPPEVRLVADHVNEGGVMACPDPFNPVYCVTRCLECSGKKDGARGRTRTS